MKELNYNAKSLTFDKPRVMGIVNVTPDSFYSGSRYSHLNDIIKKTDRMIDDGADIIDIGAVSTRPGAEDVDEKEEINRLLPVLMELRKTFPGIFISVDTFRSAVAGLCLDQGADIINDISGGVMDPGMLELVSRTGVPYIVMHIQGQPRTMQKNPRYKDVTREVMDFLTEKADEFRQAGSSMVIIDPGFGFGKNVQHNYALLRDLHKFRDLGYPVLAGLSRKSFINQVIQTKPETALNGTTVLNTIALMNGADILRVHDVKPAAEAVKLFVYYSGGIA